MDVLENLIADNFDLILFLDTNISNFEDNFLVSLYVGLLHHLVIKVFMPSLFFYLFNLIGYSFYLLTPKLYMGMKLGALEPASAAV